MKFLSSIISMGVLLGLSMATPVLEPETETSSNRKDRDICEYANGQLIRLGTAGGDCGIVNIHGREKRGNGIDYVGQMSAGIINVQGREKRSSGVSNVDSMNAGIINVIGGHPRVRRHGIGQVGEMHANTVIANGREKRSAIDHIGTLTAGSTHLEAGSGAPAVGSLGAASLHQVDLDRPKRDGIGQIGNLHAHTVIANGRVRRDGIGQVGNMYAGTVIANGRKRRSAIGGVDHVVTGSFQGYGGVETPAVGQIDALKTGSVDTVKSSKGTPAIGNVF